MIARLAAASSVVLLALASADAAERVSVATGGARSDASSLLQDLSDDGRWVAFVSGATTLVPFAPRRGLYLRDRLARTTRLVLAVDGSGYGGGARLTGDGRFAVVVAATAASPYEWFTHAVVVSRDGAVIETVDRSAAGVLGDGVVDAAVISDDARFVAFTSTATNLLGAPAGGAPGHRNVYWRDRVAGAVRCLSLTDAGASASGDSRVCGISDSGRWIALWSDSPELGPDGRRIGHIYLANAFTGTRRRIDLASGGAPPHATAVEAAISGDGRFVAFGSYASNLVPGDVDANGREDVFVYDRLAPPWRHPVERASVSSAGIGGDLDSLWVSISDDGRYVGFVSDSGNLAPDAPAGNRLAFVRDRLLGRTRLVSRRADGSPLGAAPAQISGDGRLVAWDSWAPEVDPGDPRRLDDVFIGPAFPRFVVLPLPPWLVRLLDLLAAPVGRG